jgi:hypothetical protein
MENKTVIFLIILVLIMLIINSTVLFSKNTAKENGNQTIFNQISKFFKFNSSAVNKSVTSKESPESSSSSGSSSAGSTSSNQNSIINQTTNSTANSSNSSSVQPVIEACLAKYNLTRSTIVFYYFDEPHSNNMKIIVNQLTNYTFYIKSTLTDSQFNLCLGYSSFTVPTFICAGTKQSLVGEVPKASLEAFAASCK